MFQKINSGPQFKRNFLTLAGANLLAQALGILVLPLLSRMYAPADFAILGAVVALSTIFSSVSTLKVEWSVPQAKSNAEVVAILKIGCGILIASSLLTFVILNNGAWSKFLMGALRPQPTDFFVPNLALIVTASVLFTGLFGLLKVWIVRSGELKPIGLAAIIQNVVKSLISLIGGYFSLGSIGLIVAFAFSKFSAFIFLLPKFIKDLNPERRGPAKYLLPTWSAIRRESLWSTAVSFLNTLSRNLPLLLLIAFYGNGEVGVYALLVSMVGLPLTLLTTSMSQSYWAHSAELVRAGEYRALQLHYKQITRRLCFIAIIVTLICLLASPFLALILGVEKWEGAGLVLIMMTPRFIGSVIGSPTNHLVALGVQYKQLVSDSLRVVLSVTAIVFCDLWGASFYAAVLSLSLCSLIAHLHLVYAHVSTHSQIVRCQ